MGLTLFITGGALKQIAHHPSFILCIICCSTLPEGSVDFQSNIKITVKDFVSKDESLSQKIKI
jgi:hypothetical protein